MVFSYYLTYPFYNVIWYALKLFRRKHKAILYCEDAFDIELYKNVGKYLEPIEIVAKNKQVKNKLITLGYNNISIMPSFPDSVIMFRNMAWKFPCKKIKKIGFKHGAFNFKAHSKASYYNMFDLFFLTSSSEIENVRKLGVTIPLYAAYPKIDSIFEITADDLQKLTQKRNFNPDKKTLLFSSTWDGSGMSAIEKWYDKLNLLTQKYNILVTVHEWMSDKYKKALQENNDIYYINDFDKLPYIMLADVCINDTSSFIAECCLLDKPLITFKVPNARRTLPYIIDMLDRISMRIDDFEELENAIEQVLAHTEMHKGERQKASEMMFDTPDGLSGKRAAEKIEEVRGKK